MGSIKFESVRRTADGWSITFSSYLRKDFVEKSAVIHLSDDFTVTYIFLTSHEFGSVEWNNGTGLSGCRKWETDEQAESSGYLTRRYTARFSNGCAPEGHAENFLIPDIINSIENRQVAELLKSVLGMKKTGIKLNPHDYGLE